MAADLQDPPEFIPDLLVHWREGYHVVWAAREGREGASWSTKLLSGIYYRLMRRLTLPEIPEKGADFLLMDRKVIDAYNAAPEQNTSFLALIHWIGFRQTTIQYVKQARLAGKSKWTFSKKLKLAVDAMASFSFAPIRLMSCFGATMAFCGFLYATVVVAGRLMGWIVAGTGYAAIMVVLLVGQGAIMLMLGVLGEYLWRTLDAARGRPKYIVEECIRGGGTPGQSEDEPPKEADLLTTGGRQTSAHGGRS
jgi:dolichol-phosphate mannosyltransferase